MATRKKYKEQLTALEEDICPECGRAGLLWGAFELELPLVYRNAHCEYCESRFDVFYKMLSFRKVD